MITISIAAVAYIAQPTTHFQPRSVTHGEFAAAARACGVSLEYEHRRDAGYAASLSPDGQVLSLIDNRTEELKCLENWGIKQKLLVVIRRI